MSRVQTPAAGRKSRGSRILGWLIALLVAAGVCVMAYPTVSDWQNSYRAEKAISTYERAVDEAQEDKLAQMLREAEAYNEDLLDRANPFGLPEEMLARYDELLNLSGDGLMGYVNIPSIQVNIPFYHGTDEDILKRSVGHIEWTSLPVGGTDTHTVLSGHRGLPSAKLFTDLDKMKIGERFTLTVLGRTLTYEIDQILTVLPEQAKDLAVVPGGDYCTLVTCTPYGINTHRLLVRGHRVENAPEEPAAEAPAEQARASWLMIPAVGIPLLLLILLGLLAYYARIERALRQKAARRERHRSQ